jgi:hypothetical protein
MIARIESATRRGSGPRRAPHSTQYRWSGASGAKHSAHRPGFAQGRSSSVEAPAISIREFRVGWL